jgi:hypothetical protein
VDVTELLRTEVGLLRQRETRRVFDTVVHVGTLGGAYDSWVSRRQDAPVVDAALRTDVVSALLERTAGLGDTLWLTRAGHPEAYDEDLDWLSAATTAFAQHGRDVGDCYAVTRYGWRDVRTGESRTWRRLRL